MSKQPTKDFLSYSDTGYFSEFICRYIDQDSKLNELYHRFPALENFEAQINEKGKSFDGKSRVVLGQVIAQQYSKLKTSASTAHNIEALKKDNTFTVTTGHQLNLFTGPLYFLYKIVSTINLTKTLKARFPDYNFVPVFWMASEDHDFEEINYFNFKGKKIQWNSNQEGAVGPFDTTGLNQVFDIVSAEFGSGKNAEQLKSWFKEAYLSHETLADATRYLANELFGTHGLVVVDANDKVLKQQFVPFLEKELFDQVGFNTVTETNALLEKMGLKIQVNPRDINLFYIKKGLRERIVLNDGKYTVVNSEISWSKKELRHELHEHPQRFSPNVIVRPLYQEVVLPNLCYIGGGGEMIYWLQLKHNFNSQGVPFPILLPRNSVLIKSNKQTEKLKKLDISNSDLFLERNTFINKRVRKISNIDIDFSKQIKHLEQQFKDLYKLAEQTDKSFLGAVKAQEVKQIKGLKKLEKRLLKAQKRKLKDQIERSTDLQEQLFPNQGLQERSLNFSELYLEYGNDLVPVLLNSLEPLKLEFTILEMPL